MPAAQREQLVLELPHAEAVNEALVNQMIGYMVDLRHREFELLIDAQVRSSGLDEALSGLIFQFLEKVGILWHTNRILPAQEHIVSNIIRQKVIRAIDELPYPEDSEPLFVLMLPDGEYHELGLLFVSYMLRKKGLSQIYLGSSVPMEDLFFLVKAARPQYVYLHLTSFTVHHHFSRFLQQLSQNAGTTRILLSGIVPQAYRKDLPSNATLFSTLRELRQFLDNQ